MRWHVALALGLAAWGAYALTRSGSNSRRFALDSNAPGNGRPHPGGPGSVPRRAQQEPAPTVSNTANERIEAQSLIHVSWNVRVPEGTPATARLYICGNHPALGHWNPMGVALQPTDARLYQGDLRLPAGTSFEYKFTRGSWASVEVLRSGADRPNRLLDLRTSGVIESEVEAWADQF